MQTPRRFLPSLALLQAFEAAARLESITAAAHELSLTQSAVSRQIRALEDQLGTVMFHREKQTIRLTQGGVSYARDIRDALHKISQASMNLRANPAGGTLSVATPPTFGARWLTPRLPGFLRDNPGVSLNLISRVGPVDFTTDAVDAAIQLAGSEGPGLESRPLMAETVLPCCSPALRRQFDFATVAMLRQAPLLHLTSRPDAWERYLSHHDVDATNVHGMLFDQYATVIQACVSGLGVALLPLILIGEELADGRLQPALHRPMRSEKGYQLIWPALRSDYPPLRLFAEWLAGETATHDSRSPAALDQ